MKRSEMVDLIHFIISKELRTTEEFNKKDCEKLLDKLEQKGMRPPKIKAKVKYPDTRWGAGCTTRCVCQECDPDFLITEWENE